MLARHTSGIEGPITAEATHPDGSRIVRIEDHWFFAADCVGVE